MLCVLDAFFAFFDACDLVRIAIEVRRELRADMEGVLMMEHTSFQGQYGTMKQKEKRRWGGTENR